MNLWWQTHSSTWGDILIVCDEKGLVRVTLPGENISKSLNQLCKTRETILTFKSTRLIRHTCKQLDEYLNGERENFRLEFSYCGTEFQKKVWKALQKIPFGETRSYQDIAKDIGNPKAVRAVGMANNKNPIPIIIPCHRVIGKNGDLTGYGGGLPMKRKLLHLEQLVITKQKESKSDRKTVSSLPNATI